MTRHRRTRIRGLCPCPQCRFPIEVHGTTALHIEGCDCDYCTRAAQTGRVLKNYIIRKEAS